MTIIKEKIIFKSCRSFPGFFSRKSYLGKRKIQSPKTYSTPYTKTWRPFSFYVYLLNINSETTPTSSEESELAQAGLGKRHLTMSRDMSHKEVLKIKLSSKRLIFKT